MKEISYGVRELQAHISEALRAVHAGTRVVIVSRNRPVAELVTIRKPSKKLSAQARKLERLCREGRLIPPSKTGLLPPFKGVPMPGLLEEFLANRR